MDTLTANAFSEEAYRQALSLMRQCLTVAGFTESPVKVDKYRRVWARDGIITGLAALASGENKLIDGMERTLDTLIAHRGPHGEIPTNVSLDRKQVSFGQLAGRVDAGLWFIIGLCAYLHYKGHGVTRSLYKSAVYRAIWLAECWEYNNRGLIYAPLAGNWADEYLLHGHVLSDQLLYLLALEYAAYIFDVDEWREKAASLRQLLVINYWPRRSLIGDARIYNARAYRSQAEQAETQHWLAAFSPLGYICVFDGLAHALALIAGLGDDEQWQRAEQYAQGLETGIGSPLLPAFWPVIFPGDALWAVLEANRLYDEVKNQPYHYYNGGLWPAVSGLYILGLLHYAKKERAEHIFNALNRANAQGREGREWEFAAYHHGQTHEPLGTPYLAWNAAVTILAHQALKNDFSLLPRD
jgi:hypothetical protein